jgi:hypothetical protein
VVWVEKNLGIKFCKCWREAVVCIMELIKVCQNKKKNCPQSLTVWTSDSCAGGLILYQSGNFVRPSGLFCTGQEMQCISFLLCSGFWATQKVCLQLTLCCIRQKCSFSCVVGFKKQKKRKGEKKRYLVSVTLFWLLYSTVRFGKSQTLNFKP